MAFTPLPIDWLGTDPSATVGHAATHNAAHRAINGLVGASRNVRDYGAAGDAVTDDAPAFTAAITAAAAAGGGTVFVPPGTYALGATVTLLERVVLVGAGMTATVLSPTSAVPVLSVTGGPNGGPVRLEFAGISELSIVGDASQQWGAPGIRVANSNQCCIRRVRIERLGGWGIQCAVDGGVGADQLFLEDVSIGYCVAGGLDRGSGGSSTHWSRGLIEHCGKANDPNTGIGVRMLAGAGTLYVHDLDIEQNYHVGAYLLGTRNVRFHACTWENNGRHWSDASIPGNTLMAATDPRIAHIWVDAGTQAVGLDLAGNFFHPIDNADATNGLMHAVRLDNARGVTMRGNYANAMHRWHAAGEVVKVAAGCRDVQSDRWAMYSVVSDSWNGPFTRTPWRIARAEPAELLVADRFSYREDFLHGGTASGAVGRDGWTVGPNGTVTNVTPGGTPLGANPVGAKLLTANATASAVAFLATPQTSFVANFDFDLCIRAAAVSLDAQSHQRLGLSTNTGTDTPTNGIYFERKGDINNNWRAVCRATTETAVDMGAAADANYHWFRIRRKKDPANADAASIWFSIDGGAETKIATNIPGGVLLYAIVQTVNGATVTGTQIAVDAVTYEVEGLARG